MPKVLVIDDNRPFAENLCEILEEAGHEVVIATSGEEALQRVAGASFDVMLSDMRMPEMGGAELVHRMRQLDPGLPALVITAFTRDNDLERARQEGLLAILPKPVPIPVLLSLIACARRDGLVALIEDDSKLLDNLTEALRERGFATVTASTVLEAARLGAVTPFVALVDLRVPGGPDGEAMRALLARYPGIATLVMTAHPDGPILAGTQSVFIKPFQTADLLNAVEKLHSQHRASRLGKRPSKDPAVGR